MIENKTKHTFVLTIDEATAQTAKKDPILFGHIKVILMMNGMEREHGQLVKGGLHYMRTVQA